MKLEEGMYARIDGKIGKVVQICKCEQCELRGYYEPTIEYAHGEKDYVSVYWKDNLKASYNIIDLIEVGDYVNGYLVLFAGATTWDNDGNVLDKQVHINHNGYDLWLREEYIKSIVTKEQFSQIEYKVN